MENIAFGVLAASAAGLVVVVARRAGAPRWAATGAGVFYATWSVTVQAGSTVRLEPLGDFLLVLAVHHLALGQTASRRQLVVAGVLFGLLLNVKLWWVVPIVLIFVLSTPRHRGLREVVLVPLAAILTCVAIDLPFLVLSRGHMIASVIWSQLGRTDTQGTPSGEFGRLSTMVRLERLTGMEGVMGRLHGIDPADADVRVRVVTVVVCGLVVLTAAMALRTALGRVFVPVLAGQVAILLSAPVYFPYYGDFVGVSLAMVVAAAARPLGWRPGALPWPAIWPLGAALTLVLMLTAPKAVSVFRVPDRQVLTRATEDIPCIVADTAALLIYVDALDRSFEDGCRQLGRFPRSWTRRRPRSVCLCLRASVDAGMETNHDALLPLW